MENKALNNSWRTLLHELTVLNEAGRVNESLSDNISRYLEIFLKLQGAITCSLFMVDDQYDFLHSKTIPDSKSDEQENFFRTLIDIGAIGEILSSGKIKYFSENFGEKDRNILITPLITSSGLTGIVLVESDQPFSKYEIATFDLVSLISSGLAAVIENYKLRKELHSEKGLVDQKVAARTLSIEQHRRELKTVLESVKTAILSVDKKTNLIMDANLQATELMKVKKEVILGTNYNTYFEKLNDENEFKLVVDSPETIIVYKTISEALLTGREYLIVSFFDITERKKNEEKIKQFTVELQEAIRTKDKFFSIISHDLRSPFQAILGFSSILVEDYKDFSREEVYDNIVLINKAVTNSYNLLENLLTWARLQIGRIEIFPTMLQIKNLVNNVAMLLGNNALHKGINISTEGVENITVWADETMLASVVQNIISNALKFTKSGGEIKICSEEVDGFARITIADNGLGMSEDKVKGIFVPDKNRSTPGTAGEPGTGLGLLLCKEMIDKNKGKIWVESEIGKGTTFFIELIKG